MTRASRCPSFGFAICSPSRSPAREDQAAATEEQWQAALDRAEAWYNEVQDPDADWFEIALDSDDPGSRDNGGDLGWYDPTSGGFVPEVEETIADLGVGEISEPVESDFGYHVIQVTDQRTTALEFAEETDRGPPGGPGRLWGDRAGRQRGLVDPPG